MRRFALEEGKIETATRVPPNEKGEEEEKLDEQVQNWPTVLTSLASSKFPKSLRTSVLLTYYRYVTRIGSDACTAAEEGELVEGQEEGTGHTAGGSD